MDNVGVFVCVCVRMRVRVGYIEHQRGDAKTQRDKRESTHAAGRKKEAKRSAVSLVPTSGTDNHSELYMNTNLCDLPLLAVKFILCLLTRFTTKWP